MQYRSLQPKEKTIEHGMCNETKTPQYPSANVRPSVGFVLEIDGTFALEYGTLMGALKAGLELRNKFPHSQVKMHDV